MGEGNFQDYGMRMYNPRLGRFFSVDPITKQYPMLTPYQFASNTPIQAIDLDGLEAWIAIWATQSKDTNGDGSPQIGHTAIVVENFEKVIDANGKASYKSMGTYSYYDLWPESANLGGKAATKDVSPVYNSSSFQITTNGSKNSSHTSLENYISNHDISQLPLMLQGVPENSIKGYGEGYSPDGILKIDFTPEQTFNLQQKINSLIIDNKMYNGVSNNCTSFVCDALNSSGIIEVGTETILDWRGFFIGSFSAYTPNETYKQLTVPTNNPTTNNVKKTTVIKDASKKTQESYEDAIIDR
jgi:hypothetical protein